MAAEKARSGGLSWYGVLVYAYACKCARVCAGACGRLCARVISCVVSCRELCRGLGCGCACDNVIVALAQLSSPAPPFASGTKTATDDLMYLAHTRCPPHPRLLLELLVVGDPCDPFRDPLAGVGNPCDPQN